MTMEALVVWILQSTCSDVGFLIMIFGALFNKIDMSFAASTDSARRRTFYLTCFVSIDA